MKRIAFLFVLCVAAFSFRATELSIGDALPKADVKVQDISGKDLTLKDASKKNGLLVMFSCNTCPYVIKNQERAKAILQYAQSKNIGVVVLNSNEAYRGNEDSYAAMKSYAADQGYKWTYAIDKNHELADAFGATRTPECFLFNSQSKLVYHGAIDDSPADASAVSKIYLKEAINEMTEGKEVTVKTSRSIGCSIKRLKS
jgi:thioredoxin-related protein